MPEHEHATTDGWDWLKPEGARIEPPAELCRAAAACLTGPNAGLLLRHLRCLFLDRRLPPSATDAELRHVEGQRSVVSHLLQLVDRGRGAASPPDATMPALRVLR